ncbi:uracil-DNA glycosylase [Rhodanobacter thiooxydans]|uniref:Type-4 uracil-DNA glycosylase n=1 Tax=Rhodanobacter thiooxydans TaxID=416169 RepID=A0A154QEL0_9GAMM|nr:UdgX family uracil-DNA binding protein [Rhodanobacter thiooxydans]EIL99288.1 phage SPO1 DNA polymerase-like protein [Rhodanobacter thiooxydans LCS2]KZC22731.1 uracil-DNA glycosylase [Rhodanobacter thiooxydans]MCW0202108.1 UdgX family uracil-DNA binding protein [Rhodanobacter thiooxydans]
MIALAKPVEHVPAGNLATLRRMAADCRACPLWRQATQIVFGRGPAHAAAMLIGEQPGAQEDLAGEPFVGPAGQLLDRALAEAGLDRSTLYLTNTVKHFKYELRGKVRLHKRANATEQAACRHWLAAELARVQPRLVIGLGAMAAQTLFGKDFRIGSERGRWRELGPQARGLATWHPSAVLRTPREARRHEAYAELVTDLRAVAAALAALSDADGATR